MPAPAASTPRHRLAPVVLAHALPILFFYGMLLHFVRNIPQYDDYDAGLSYLIHTAQTPTLSGKLLYLIAAQQNEYKIVFGHAVVWLQYAVFGNVNFALTCFLGNLFVLGIGWVLWKMFMPKETDVARRLLLFLPVTVLLFQFNYSETLNWAMPCLQNVNVVFFVLAAIYLLTRGSGGAFVGGAGMMMLAISASGNGFLLVPVGLIILFLGRMYGRMAIWLGAMVVCLAGYAYHYNSMSSQGDPNHSVLHAILHMNPMYIVAFLGSSAFVPHAASLVLGLAIAVAIGYIVRQGYWRKNPAICYSVLFVLLTAVGVAGIRSSIGLGQATSSRYRIYCDLLLIFVWFYIAEEVIAGRDTPLRQRKIFTRCLAACCVFAVLADVWGVSYLYRRDRGLEVGMRLYEHPQPQQPAGPVYPQANQLPAWDQWDAQARGIMIQSVQMGIYRPPNY